MRPIGRIISIDEARELLVSHVRPMTRSERVPLAHAAGRVASADVMAQVSVPPFSRSAMDGYAVIAADTAGASHQTPVTLPITERVFTGNTPIHGISRGECSEIATGAPLRSDFSAGIRDVAFAQACYRSLASGASVRVAGENVVWLHAAMIPWIVLLAWALYRPAGSTRSPWTRNRKSPMRWK